MKNLGANRGKIPRSKPVESSPNPWVANRTKLMPRMVPFLPVVISSASDHVFLKTVFDFLKSVRTVRTDRPRGPPARTARADIADKTPSRIRTGFIWLSGYPVIRYIRRIDLRPPSWEMISQDGTPKHGPNTFRFEFFGFLDVP